MWNDKLSTTIKIKAKINAEFKEDSAHGSRRVLGRVLFPQEYVSDVFFELHQTLSLSKKNWQNKPLSTLVNNKSP
ncbi:MAG: hypothetical protein KBE91_10780 [Bacteroidia bacterium]|nr:hypothetical protein [Bacteroidia bacterium]